MGCPLRVPCVFTLRRCSAWGAFLAVLLLGPTTYLCPSVLTAKCVVFARLPSYLQGRQHRGDIEVLLHWFNPLVVAQPPGAGDRGTHPERSRSREAQRLPGESPATLSATRGSYRALETKDKNLRQVFTLAALNAPCLACAIRPPTSPPPSHCSLTAATCRAKSTGSPLEKS